MKTILISLSLLLFAFPAVPQPIGCSISSVELDPPHAYQGERVEVHVAGGCPSGGFPLEPIVSFDGNTIHIDFSLGSSGPLVPVAFRERVRLGTLNPGTYAIVARNNGVETIRRTLIVEPRPFHVEPMSGPAGSRVLITRAPIAVCDAPSCSEQVLFGGVPAQIVGYGS